MNKPHIHAASMAEYAKDAAETDKPWERWETLFGHKWYSLLRSPDWDINQQYRRKQGTIVVWVNVYPLHPTAYHEDEAEARSVCGSVGRTVKLIEAPDQR